MRTLLVLAQHPALAEAVRAAVNPEAYRIVHRAGVDEAEPFLAHGLAEGVIIEVGTNDVQGVWMLEKLHRRAPRGPVLIYTGASPWEWEEEAYLQGVAHVLTLPVKPRLLNSLLERLWAAPAPGVQKMSPVPLPVLVPTSLRSEEAARPTEIHSTTGSGPSQALGVLRDFSAILTHSLNAEGMLRQFLQLLREILSINRGAIFLRPPTTPFDNAASREESRHLRAASSIGLSTGLLQHFELSFDAGIGGQLVRLGRILRRYSDEALNDAAAQKEFQLLASQVAVPILYHEAAIA